MFKEALIKNTKLVANQHSESLPAQRIAVEYMRSHNFQALLYFLNCKLYLLPNLCQLMPK